MLNAITGSGTIEAAVPQEKTMGKDEFLKLFVAQMENQDPLDPLDNAEFTAQLAQFSSLEQLLGINKNLENNQEIQRSLNNSQSVAYLDREISAVGNSAILSDGTAMINYSLMNDATEVIIGIYDSQDDLVKSESVGQQSGGDQQFIWDGTDSNGQPLRDGIYTFAIGASGPAGEVETTGYITGRVNAISYEDGSAVLSVNGIEIKHEDIKSIR